MRLIFWCVLLFFSQVHAQANTFDLFEENGKVGLKNDQGNILIPALYDALGWPDRELVIHKGVIGYRKGDHWGLISIQNKIVTPPQFTTLQPASGNYVIAAMKQQQSFRIKKGCIDVSGKVIIPYEYDGIELHDLRAIVHNRNQNKILFGVINLKNEIIIPVQYPDIIPVGNMRYAVENQDGKKALFTDQGKKITEFSIDRISPFRKDFAILFEGDKQGLIDRNGTIRLTPDHQEITISSDGQVQIRKPNSWQILNSENLLLQQLAVDSIQPLSVDRYAITHNGNSMLTDGSFKPLTEQSFSSINPFIGDYALFKQNNKFGVIQTDGKILLQPKYDLLQPDRTFFISMVHENGFQFWSLIDRQGEAVSQKTYDQILPYNGKFYPVKKRGYWGAMNSAGKEFISCVYDSLLQLRDDIIVVEFHNQFGVIDMEENWKVIPQQDELKVVYSDRYVQNNGETSFLKTFTGGVVYFTENDLIPYAAFMEEKTSNGSLWRVNYDGQIIYRQLPPESAYEKLFAETEGLRAIKKNGRFGFIDDRGRLRIANRYEDVKPFSEKLAAVQILNRWGFIDHEERIIVQPVYDHVTSFEKGISIVTAKGKFGMIDITGKVLIPPAFDRITPLPSGRYLTTQNNQSGLVDKNGNLLIQSKYDSLEDLDNGYVLIRKNDKYGLMTIHGVSTIPLIYDYLTFDGINNRYFGLQKSEWKEFK